MAKRRRERRQQQVVQEHPVRIITESCQLVYSDMVNVSLSNTGEVAITFYKGAPDPSSISQKTPAYYAQVIAQIPFNLAIRLPGAIFGHLLQSTEVPADGIEQAIVYLRALTEQMQTKLSEVKTQHGSKKE